MPWPTAALSGANLTKLRGTTYDAAQYISVNTAPTLYTARVNGTPTGQSYAQFNYDGGSGTLATVIQDMRILISHTNDRRAAFFDGRIRLTPSGSILYVNETSAAILDDDYIFAVNDFKIADKLARPIGSTQYKDYDLTYRRLRPKIKNLQSAYCGWIANPASLSTKFRVAFNIATSYVTDTTASGSLAYLWVLPAGASVISGGTTSAAITIDFASSVGDWLHVTITDSNGNTNTRHVFIHAASDTYPPLLATDKLSIQNDVYSGWSASLDAFAGVDSLLDNTLMVGWDVEHYSGTEGAILAPVKFIGRFRQATGTSQTDESYSLVQDVRYTIESPAAQLQRIESLPRALLPSTTTTTTWDTIENLTPWRAIAYLLDEHSTFCSLHELDFDDQSDTFLIPQVGIQGSNLYDAIKDLAQSINAIFEFAPQGESRVVREANYLDDTDRNLLITVANFTNQDWTKIEIVNDPVDTVGKVESSGAFYNASTGVETPLLSLAPGVAQGAGAETPTLARQYLQANVDQTTAQDELDQRTADHEARKNARDTVTLKVTFPDGYNFLAPSVELWYTWTIAATENLLGLVYDTGARWLLTAISVEHDNVTGTKNVNATFLKETQGDGAQAVQYPAINEVSPYLPDIPAFGPYDLAFPEDTSLYLGDSPLAIDIPPQTLGLTTTTVPRDGNTVLAWNGTNAWVTQKFLQSANPPWADVTPFDLNPNAGWSSTFNFALSDGGWTGTAGTYALGSGWVTTTLINSNNQIRVLLYIAPPSGIPAGTTIAMTYDVTNVALNGIEILTTAAPGYPPALESFNDSTVTCDDFTNRTFTALTTVAAARVYLNIDAEYSAGDGCPGGVGTVKSVTLSNPNGTDPFGNTPNLTNVVYADFDPFVSSAGKVGAYILANDNTNSFVYYTADVFAAVPVWIAGASVSGLYTMLRTTSTKGTIELYHPALAGSAVSRVSTDRGTAWASPVTAGATPGSAAGFDRIIIGTVTLAAISAKAEKATTFGGAYSDEANGGSAATYAKAILVPAGQKGSATNNNISTSTPQYIFATPATFSGKSVIWVTGSQIDITPTVGGNPGLATSPDCLAAWRGTKLFAILSFSGTRHLMYYDGSSWTDRGSVSTNTNMIKVRRRAQSPGQVSFIDGAGVKYSSTLGATLVNKTTPATTNLLGVEMWG